jgi:hypothetical protein
MHPFHTHLARQLIEKLKKRRVVVWYDEPEDFVDFIEELATGADGGDDIQQLPVGDVVVTLVRFRDSIIRMRLAVEARVAKDVPEPLLLYLPGVAADPKRSMLLELEKAGDTINWTLKAQARNCLLKKFTDGEVDRLVKAPDLTYTEVVGAMRGTGDGAPVSPLRLIFRDHSALEVLARWLADPGDDGAIASRGAVAELYALVSSRLGLTLDSDTSLEDARLRTIRHALLAEFRDDIEGAAPSSLATILIPNADGVRNCRDLAALLREKHRTAYTALADKVEQDFRLAELQVQPATLGRIDTFRFEERLLLDHAVRLTESAKFEGAQAIAEGRRRSFWVDSDVRRQAQWQATSLAADLGLRARKVRAEVNKGAPSAEKMVAEYATSWHTLDRAHRELKARVALMDEVAVCEPAIAIVERAVEDTLEIMARTFADALRASAWTVPGVLHQTRIYPEVVQTRGGRVAWFWADAMRFEMGAELAELLREALDLRLQPAIAALPSVTPVGMAALLPGASGSFSVGVHGGELASFIEGIPLAKLDDRRQYLRGRVPGVKDIEMGKLRSMTVHALQQAIEEAPLVVVRSQDIDLIGETDGGELARSVMGTVVGNLANAVRKLAQAGVEHFVVTADHGHQFALRKGADMTTANPGGQKVELHRRFWVGRGGTTPPSTVRVRAAELGYDGDLEYVFPAGLGVFPCGGDLSFHHGSTSLQELVIPVLSFRMPQTVAPKAIGDIELSGVPERITNRIFSVRVTARGLYPRVVRVVVMHGGEYVGEAGLAVDQEFDAARKVLKLPGGATGQVAVMLTKADVSPVRVAVLDADTGATLAQSNDIPVQLGM